MHVECAVVCCPWGIYHPQDKQPQRCIPCHDDVVGDLVRRVAVPVAKTTRLDGGVGEHKG